MSRAVRRLNLAVGQVMRLLVQDLCLRPRRRHLHLGMRILVLLSLRLRLCILAVLRILDWRLSGVQVFDARRLAHVVLCGRLSLLLRVRV